MTDDSLSRLSGTNNPYATNTYTPAANGRSTLITTDYFKLLAVQLANQDMTNPIDNSEMMAQMVQMAMIQAVGAMTESVQASTSVSIQAYAAGLIGRKTTVVVTEEGEYRQDMAIGVQYRKMESTDFTGSTPVLKLTGDDNEYPLSYVLGMGKIDDPYKKDKADGKQAREKDVEGEKTDFSTYDYMAEEGNPLTDKGILARFSYIRLERTDLWG